MAMRVCVHCKREVTYERENRNLLRGGAVGFWQDVMSGQSTCPDAPLNSQGQQLHDVGDVHTPPTDPEDIEKFLDNTYVPPPPSVPCGQMYGLGEDGEFLSCGLDKGHDGDCAPATPEVAAKMQAAAEAANSADTGSGVMFMDVEHDGDTTTLSATADGVAVSVSYDKSKIGPNDVIRASRPPQRRPHRSSRRSPRRPTWTTSTTSRGSCTGARTSELRRQGQDLQAGRPCGGLHPSRAGPEAAGLARPQ
jgi:hypothetical protein